MLILESTFPNNYRENEIKKILNNATTGKFCQIIAVPGGGKATILRLLAHNRELLKYHLATEEKLLQVVYLNFLKLPNLDIGYITRCIQDSLKPNTNEANYEKLKELVNSITKEGHKLILLFDHFDEYQNQLPRTFFQLLRDLATVSRYKFSAVFATRRDLKELVDPEIAKIYYDFFLDNALYLKIQDAQATNLLISQTEDVFKKKLKPTDKITISEIAAGHAKLTKLIAELVLRDNITLNIESLIQNPLISAALYEIWNFLTSQEQQILISAAAGNQLTQDTPQSLTSSGILGPDFTITIPMFKQFILGNVSNLTSEKISYDTTTREIKKGTIVISDLLSPQEFRLLRFLTEQSNKVTTREEIIASVWPDAQVAEGISDEAIDQMIFRLRKKIEDKPNTPKHITTVKGQGWRFDP